MEIINKSITFFFSSKKVTKINSTNTNSPTHDTNDIISPNSFEALWHHTNVNNNNNENGIHKSVIQQSSKQNFLNHNDNNRCRPSVAVKKNPENQDDYAKKKVVPGEKSFSESI